MKNSKWYEWGIPVVYVGMIILCVLLNLFSGQRESIASIIVNAAMFLIVGIIFYSCMKNSFGPMNRIIDELEAANERIRRDAVSTRDYLWDTYETEKVDLFNAEPLQSLYRDYKREVKRDKKTSYYKCSIDDYVNEDIVDSVMHRNQLNQVPGALTGLGILGTFIGLSLGLQSFNTGTTVEMTNSIEPLMNGIKVAFHTSIYGMIFSLTFNYILKRKLYEAETAVHEFASSYRKYVMPDLTNTGTNLMLEMQKQEIEAIRNMTASITDEMAAVLEPQFNSLNTLILDFAKVATREQTEALQAVTGRFIEEMNKQMNGAFTEMGEIVHEEYKILQNSGKLTQDILTSTGTAAGNLNAINEETQKLVQSLNEYTKSIDSVMAEIRRSVALIGEQNRTSIGIMEKERANRETEDKLMGDLKNSVVKLGKQSESSSNSIKASCDTLSSSVDDLVELLESYQSKSRRTK